MKTLDHISGSQLCRPVMEKAGRVLFSLFVLLFAAALTFSFSIYEVLSLSTSGQTSNQENVLENTLLQSDLAEAQNTFANSRTSGNPAFKRTSSRRQLRFAAFGELTGDADVPARILFAWSRRTGENILCGPESRYTALQYQKSLFIRAGPENADPVLIG